MKRQKILVCALLAVAMLLSMTACKTEEPANILPADDGAKTLTLVTSADFPPYEFYQNEKVVGIDAEIAGKIAEKLGMTLRIEDVDFDAVVTSVQSGKYDMAMAGLTVNEERLEQVNFTTSYATGVQVIIVPEGSAITSADDLMIKDKNYKIGVQFATTGDTYVTEDLEDEGLATIERYTKGSEAIMALTSGKVDCVVIDNEPAKAFVKANPGLKILDTEYIVEQYAIAINKENTDLMNKVNQALEALISDGTIQTIIDKYIPPEGD